VCLSLRRFAGLGAVALKSNFVPLGRPYKINYSVTLWCQSRCGTCEIWKLKPKDELRIDEIREFVKKNNYFRWVELTGGEPFLRHDLVDIAKIFADNCKNLYMLTMPTNSLCNHDVIIAKIKAIAALRIPKVIITISLDGYKELHDKIRGVQGNYDKAIWLFKSLIDLKKEFGNLHFVFGYTMSKFNEGQFEKTFAAVKEAIPSITYNDFHINLSQNSSNYYHNETLSLSPMSKTAADEIMEINRRRERTFDPMNLVEGAFLRRLEVFARNGKMPMRSRSLEASLFLDSWGNIFPSIMWDKKIGNIREIDYDLGNVWNSKDAKEVRRMEKEGTEPVQWTSCEAYQAIVGDVKSLFA
jgi:MoaA/NifB/PqqE/SkfB family radical SAM enzyme